MLYLFISVQAVDKGCVLFKSNNKYDSNESYFIQYTYNDTNNCGSTPLSNIKNQATPQGQFVFGIANVNGINVFESSFNGPRAYTEMCLLDGKGSNQYNYYVVWDPTVLTTGDLANVLQYNIKFFNCSDQATAYKTYLTGLSKTNVFLYDKTDGSPLNDLPAVTNFDGTTNTLSDWFTIADGIPSVTCGP
eukprot:CAMPEP_0170517066 /NCGR_PEP_ID=MMETSP0209-20121228/3156_1 /TAXON_ID=665100 ORGANISM="Litonotus pictus, Strain P1" /NCGR_SAMPLE_ID=MMETSP0209 /ASSEMBLY_ACC=CAM_ASM_000301 /LENGTH=189 /DNA_ID=CAMNT_0010802215 /DNA_START=26 /DNA_END=595 /DNA_ORIENTATION=-